MESRVTSLLENLLERLTKIETQQETQLKKQSQIDQVIERLDTIQNCLERQNHKQNLLHDKLSAVSVSTQMVEEKVFTNDKLLSDLSIQLKQAKDFTADQLSAISAQMESEMTKKFSSISTELEQEKVFMRDQLKEAQDEILHRLTELQQQNVSTRSQAVSVGEEMKQLQATAGPNPVKETAEFCSQADGDVVDARFAKMSETLEQSVKAVTRAELVWLGNQTDQRISELRDKVGELAEETLKIAESIKQENKDMATDFKLDVSEEIRAQNEPMMKEVQKFLTKTADKNRESISQQREDMKTFYTEIVTQVKKTSGELPVAVGEIKKWIKDHMETVKGEIIEAHSQNSQNTEKQTETAVKESVGDVLTNLDKTKRDLVAFVEGQSQIVRDRIAGPLPQHKNYVCDFYIENFRQLVRSGKTVTSLPWHINQFDSSVRGSVDFPTSGKMNVYLMHGRHPRQLGLPSRARVRLKYKAIIKDTSDQLPALAIGEVTSTWEEDNVKDNNYWGSDLGEMSCDELIDEGYGDKEGYMNGALLVRYKIVVL